MEINFDSIRKPNHNNARKNVPNYNENRRNHKNKALCSFCKDRVDVESDPVIKKPHVACESIEDNAFIVLVVKNLASF